MPSASKENKEDEGRSKRQPQTGVPHSQQPGEIRRQVDAPASQPGQLLPPPRPARGERGRRLPGRRGRSDGAERAGAGCGCRGRQCGPPPQGGRRTWGEAGRQNDVSTTPRRSGGHEQESKSKQEASRPQRPVEGRGDPEKPWIPSWREHKVSPLQGVGPGQGRPGCAERLEAAGVCITSPRGTQLCSCRCRSGPPAPRSAPLARAG
jgi:hypothetical protein